MRDYNKTITHGFKTFGYRQGTKECVAFHKGIEYADANPLDWTPVATAMPEAGRMICKRWRSGAVWAGMYNATAKEGSFDEWCYLP